MNGEFGTNFERVLAEKGTNMNRLSKKTGIATSRLSEYIQKGAKPSSDKLILIADALDVSVDYLLGRESTFSNNSGNAVVGYNYGNATAGIGNAPPDLTAEQQELNRVYATLSPRRRVKLMSLAFELEDEENGGGEKRQ